MLLDDIHKEIINSFGSLWKFKERGDSLEIITPYATTNDKFISVFLTKQGKDYIVSDGGWIHTEVYENVSENEAVCFQKIHYHYLDSYDIQTTADKSKVKFYYKKTNSPIAIPSLVFDLANFVSAIVSASFVSFEDAKEKEERENFRRKANSYLLSVVGKQIMKLNKPLDESHKTNVKFNAIITGSKNRVTLVNYVTGSLPNYFINSICKASVNFEIADKSKYKPHISNRIALLNNKADGYLPERLNDYLELLENVAKTPPILWTEREKIKEFV